MTKTILITGATDGIGRETAKSLAALGHTILLHGRNAAKLATVEQELTTGSGQVGSFVADLSNMAEVLALAKAVAAQNPKLDVLINNAGVFKTTNPITPDGLDVRFVVNAIAPYLLTQKLMPLLNPSSRVVNVSSAAQSPVNLKALAGRVKIAQDFSAYAQSKLALTMWSRVLALKPNNPVIVAVNPGSMLGSKMVKQAFGVPGGDLRIGADILTRAVLADDFATASGKYFDNDSGQFAPPHGDALDAQKCEAVVSTIESIFRGSRDD
ncbi:MAG: SDR family NAD(P)-dependent oxidoreductase [Spirulina sp. SIO3F2]|nr:SDR family NAD(P)-dependent oxidoreductase [Spirulina sp. SIO3F2]